MRKFLTKTAAFAATAAALVLAAGCSNDAAAPGAESASGLQVAATTTQLQDFVHNIGGDKVQVTGLLKPGSSAHSFDPSPADLKALAAADILLVNGAGLDDFIHSAVEASGFKGEIVTVADGVDLAEAAEITAAARGGAIHNPADASHDHSVDHDAEHDHGTHHAHGANGTIDPHIWTSPRYANAMLQPIAQALAAADSENAEFYRQNAAAYGAKLVALDEWLGNSFGQVDPAKKKFVSTHNALLYFLHDYQITYVGSVIPSFEDNAEPSAAELKTLVENIKAAGVPAIFVESSNSPRLNSTVAKEAGIPVVSDPIYADSLAAEGEASTYIGATISNARTMLTAWGYELSEPPAELQ